ncbi:MULTISPECIES: universal stress protein [Megasphaera]|uniref:Universal stress family protein n=1 Tax=Megasphaera hutchinsoni TaxID=1588748 RepID=A0A134CLG2_9FIRM|nr:MULTISPECIES: universal stress protein [Megasphaera]EGS36356.1 universal stress family protein [Megasphaera sp. UPII 135-E]KXB93048.1 universal stress family protein [Megasphaera hutchinsoni]MUP48964.1 universal stress protein [Veillonellaceae bacterium M2-8]PNH21547.1 universal stress protein [Megasphaera genomosp. type_2]
MAEYKNIIVPTDGSVNSKRAVEHAVTIAELSKSVITLVYVANIVSVISNFDQIPNSSGYVTEQVAMDMEKEGKAVLDNFVKQIPDGIETASVFEVGSPGPAILSVAKKNNADLIIMGSRGLGPIKGLFMGSVSSYVVTHSVCPVMIVK